MLVDFTGLAISYARIAPHRTGYGSIPNRSALYGPVGRSIHAVLNNFSRSTIDNLLRPSWAGPLSYVLEHVTPCRRQLGTMTHMTDLKCERQHYGISDLANGSSNRHSVYDFD